MSGTHSHTAAAQADVQRSDVQGRRPNVPPGHVEGAGRPRRVGSRITGSVIGVAAAVIAAAIGLAFLIA